MIIIMLRPYDHLVTMLSMVIMVIFLSYFEVDCDDLWVTNEGDNNFHGLYWLYWLAWTNFLSWFEIDCDDPAAQHGHNLKLIVMIFVSATNCKMNWINSNEEIGSIDVLSAKPAFQPYVDGPAQHLQFCASDPGVEHLQEYVHLQLILVWIIAVLCNKKCCSLQHCDEITVNAL